MDHLVAQAAFWIFAVLAVLSAVAVVAHKSPVTSAMNLVVTFVSVAGLYMTLGAEFLTAVQILVYAGAIMVLFLFVIMLLNLDRESFRSPGVGRMIGGAIGFAFLFGAVALVGGGGPPGGEPLRGGDAAPVGRLFAHEYLFPFEAASLLLLIAMIGAVVVARRRGPGEDESGEETGL